MAMRVMLQNGLKGLSHHPANDTLYPAGYECPWANYFYTQENAITFAGGENGRAAYIRRTGRLIEGMGPLLASTHLAADAGIIYPMATYPQTRADRRQRFSGLPTSPDVCCGRVHLIITISNSSTPITRHLRISTLSRPAFCPIRRPGKTRAKYPHLGQYSEKAQQMIVDYVAAGGTLIVLPSKPGGPILAEFLSPLGSEQFIPGTSTLHFTDGSKATIVGGVYAVTPPRRSGSHRLCP